MTDTKQGAATGTHTHAHAHADARLKPSPEPYPQSDSHQDLRRRSHQPPTPFLSGSPSNHRPPSPFQEDPPHSLSGEQTSSCQVWGPHENLPHPVCPVTVTPEQELTCCPRNFEDRCHFHSPMAEQGPTPHPSHSHTPPPRPPPSHHYSQTVH